MIRYSAGALLVFVAGFLLFHGEEAAHLGHVPGAFGRGGGRGAHVARGHARVARRRRRASHRGAGEINGGKKLLTSPWPRHPSGTT